MVDTLLIVTLEVVCLAGDGSTGVGLVAAVLTVRGAVTVPRLRNTGTRFGTPKQNEGFLLIFI